MSELLIILFLLCLIGCIFVIHLKKPEIIYLPWFGAIILTNITLILNFAKISIQKNIFEIKYFGGTTFIFLTLIFTIVVSLSIRLKRGLSYMKINGILYIVILVSMVISTFIFFNKPADIVSVKRADELKNTSLTIEMFTDQNLEKGQWEIGIPVVIGVISTIFSYSTISTLKVVHGLFTVLLGILLTSSIVKIIKLREKNAFLMVFLTIMLITFLILQIYIIPINVIFTIGLLILIINLMFDLIDRVKESRRSQIYAEEIILANALVFLASINSSVFKILTGLLIISLAICIIKRNNIFIVILKIIFFTLLLNPLLIGLALRY